jgi:hypothetical protein
VVHAELFEPNSNLLHPRRIGPEYWRGCSCSCFALILLDRPLGLSTIGIAPPHLPPPAKTTLSWIKGYHAKATQACDIRPSNHQSGMSALGQKRTLERDQVMSALPPKADIAEHDRHVCFVQIDQGRENAAMGERRSTLTTHSSRHFARISIEPRIVRRACDTG